MNDLEFDEIMDLLVDIGDQSSSIITLLDDIGEDGLKGELDADSIELVSEALMSLKIGLLALKAQEEDLIEED